MQPLQLFDLAYRQNEWLAQRQAVISSNIANVNTPGYKAKDVESFDDVMHKSLSMSVTDPQHLGSLDDANGTRHENGGDTAEVLESGNDVNLEQEFVKSSDIMRSYTMNTQIMKSFSRMLQLAIKE